MPDRGPGQARKKGQQEGLAPLTSPFYGPGGDNPRHKPRYRPHHPPHRLAFQAGRGQQVPSE